MTQPRSELGLAALANGSVIATGGYIHAPYGMSKYLSSAEMWPQAPPGRFTCGKSGCSATNSTALGRWYGSFDIILYHFGCF